MYVFFTFYTNLMQYNKIIETNNRICQICNISSNCIVFTLLNNTFCQNVTMKMLNKNNISKIHNHVGK